METHIALQSFFLFSVVDRKREPRFFEFDELLLRFQKLFNTLKKMRKEIKLQPEQMVLCFSDERTCYSVF